MSCCSTLSTFGANNSSGNFDSLNVTGDGFISGDLDVGGTVTASQFSGGSLTPTFLLPNGSASDPALAFNSSTNSGLFWESSGTAGQAWSANGTKRMKLTPTSLTVDTDVTCGTNSLTSGSVTSSSTVRGAIGSASAPSFAWGGHVTSGMFWDTGISGPALSTQGVESVSFGTSSATFSTTVGVPDGSSILPSLHFASDPTLGFRRVAPGDMALCHNNDDIFDFSDTKGFDTKGRDITAGSGSISGGSFTVGTISTGSVRTADGSIAAPAYSFTPSPTTGLYSDPIGEEDIGFTVGGVRVGYFDPYTNFYVDGGISSASGVSAPVVSSTSGGSVAFPSLRVQTTTSGFSFDGGNHALVCSANGSEYWRAENDSNSFKVAKPLISTSTITTGTNAMTCGSLSSSSIAATGTITCGTNAMTCGSMSCTSLTSTGTMSCGTNSMTCGSLSSSSIAATGTVTCGTNAMTCGAMTCGAISSTGSISTTSFFNNSAGSGFGSLLFLRPASAITADTSNSNSQSGRLYLLGAIVADRKLTLTNAPSAGHTVYATITATNANNWTVSAPTPGSNIYVRAYSTDGTPVSYTPSTGYTNIIFGSASVIGDTVTLVSNGGTAWYATVQIANHTSVTFS